MKKLGYPFARWSTVCAALFMTTSAFAGVTINAPTNNSTTATTIWFDATAQSPACPGGVAAMGIYPAPNNLVFKVSGSKLGKSLTLNPGVYDVVVQEWDNCGWSASQKVHITVGSASSGGSSSSTANAFTNLQKDSHWNGYALMPDINYDICNSCTSSGPGLTWSTKQGVSSPSKSGSSMKFTIGGTTPYADALWTNKFTTRLADQTSVPKYHNFVYELDFYADNIEASQALEFDINQFVNGKSFIWGHECRIAGGHEWDTWNNQTMHWVKSGIACNPVNGWNHLKIEAQRTSDDHLVFKSITLNGKAASANRTDTPTGTSWYGMTVNYQMDLNKTHDSYSIYLDNVTFTYF